MSSLVQLILYLSLSILGAATALPNYEGFSKLVSYNIVELLESNFPQLNISDPFPIADVPFEWNETPIGNLLVSGNLSICNNAQIRGLSQIEIIPNPLPENSSYVDVIFGVYTETLRFTGGHDMYLNITGVDYVDLVIGQGTFDMEMIGAKFILETIIKIDPTTNHFKFSNMAMHLGFDCLAVNMEGTEINGEEFDWAEFSTEFKLKFDSFWNSIKVGLSATVQFALNILTAECTVDDLLSGNVTMIRECIQASTMADLGIGGLAEFVTSSTKEPTCPQEMAIPKKSAVTKRATCDHLYEPAPTTEPDDSAASFLKINLATITILISITFLSKFTIAP